MDEELVKQMRDDLDQGSEAIAKSLAEAIVTLKLFTSELDDIAQEVELLAPTRANEEGATTDGPGTGKVPGPHSVSAAAEPSESPSDYLALLYLLEATDFHYENLIACSEHPVLIDLESLFHCRFRNDAEGGSEEMADSVLRIGLLPLRDGARQDSPGVDISGLTGHGGQVTTQALPLVVNPGTDEIVIEHRTAPIPDAGNLPTLRGQRVDLLDHEPALVRGFESTYRLLMRMKEELLGAKGLLSTFRDDEVRVILRPTHAYATLLFDKTHPDLLRNGVDQDWLWGLLWGRVEEMPYLADVIPFERRDLENGDVPFFSTTPDSRDV